MTATTAKALHIVNHVSTALAFCGICIAATAALTLVWGAGAKAGDMVWRLLGTGLIVFSGAAATLCTIRFFFGNRHG